MTSQERWIPSGFSGLNDDSWELLEDKRQEVRIAQDRLLASSITFDQALATAQVSYDSPETSPDIAIASSLAGISMDDPRFAEVLAIEAQYNAQAGDVFNKAWDTAKTGLRVGFLGLQTLWEESPISRGLRTGVQMSQGQNPIDAYRRAGTSAGIDALATMIEGDKVDLGTGILPGFTPPSESPAFAQSMTDLVGTELSNEDIVSQSLEAHFNDVGKPVVPAARRVAEATKIHWGDRTSSVSLGRMPAIVLFDPGSKPFHILSAAIDGTAQLIADPSDRMLVSYAAFRKARNTFIPDIPRTDAARVAQQVAEKEKVARSGGIFGNTRFTTHRRKVSEWAQAEGKPLREFLTTNDDIRAVDAILPDISAKKKRGLVDAKTMDEVDAILLPELGLSVLKVPGGRPLLVPQRRTLSQGIGGAIPARGDITQGVGAVGGIRSRLKYNSYENPLTRLFSDMHRGRLLASDPDAAYKTADEFMRNANFTKEKAAEYLYDLAGNDAYAIEGLFETGTSMMNEYGRILVEQEGWTNEMARAQTELWKQQTIARIYNQDDVGNPVLLESTFLFESEPVALGDKVSVQIDLPEGHLLTEYLDWGMTLPDGRRVRRGRSQIRRVRRNAVRQQRKAVDWLNRKVNTSFDEGVKLAPSEQVIMDMGKEGFEGTGDMLHYGQGDYNEILEEGSLVTMHTDLATADNIAGERIGMERYTADEIRDVARYAAEDPMVVHPGDFTPDELVARFPQELDAPPPKPFREQTRKATAADTAVRKSEAAISTQARKVRAAKQVGNEVNDFATANKLEMTQLPGKKRVANGHYTMETPWGPVTIKRQAGEGIWDIELPKQMRGQGEDFLGYDVTLPGADEAVRKAYNETITNAHGTVYTDEMVSEGLAGSLAESRKGLKGEEASFAKGEALRKEERAADFRDIDEKPTKTPEGGYTFTDGSTVTKVPGGWAYTPAGGGETVIFAKLKDATATHNAALRVVAADNPETQAFTRWFNDQRNTGGTFEVYYDQGRRWNTVKTPAKMKEHIADGAQIRFTPKKRAKTVGSLRTWYKEQTADNFAVQVREAAKDGTVESQWHTVVVEDDFITAMGRNAEVRVLPQGRAAPVTSAMAYGKSLNPYAMDLSKADEGLRNALIADGVVDELNVITRKDPKLNQTLDWMRDNGYGKYVNEDGSVSVIEDYLGYNTDSVFDDLTKGTVYAESAEKSQRLGAFLNRVKIEELGFEPAIVTAILDKYQSHLFKPLALLRAAWFARVTMEENVRMWLEGFDAFFNNPFSYVQWTVNHNLAGGLGDIRKGRANIGTIDIVDDVPITTYDNLIDSRTDHEALANIMDQMRIGRQGVQEINYGIARKGDQNYVQGWTRDVHQLAAAEEVGLVLQHGVDETIKIMKDTVEGRALRRRIALDTSPSSPKRAIADSDEALKHHLASIEGRAHRIAGGEYHMLNKDGVWVSSKNIHEPLVPQPNHPRDVPYVIVQYGDDELLKIMQEGKYGGGDFRSGRRVSSSKYKGLTNFVETKAAAGIGPETVKAANIDTAGRSETAWEKALEWAFHQLGSKPTNYLSRSPFYRQAHWDAVGRLYHHADDELRAFIDEAVTYSNLDGDFSKIVARHGNIKKVDPSTRVLTMDDADLVDDLAKAQALELTRTTLYDLSKRKNVTDGMRLMFPFGEAFIEMLTVWSRLVTQNPHVIRRGQQMFNSARSSGFFHENERGEEVFTVPGSAFVMGALGISPEGANLSIDLPVAGFNMITQNPLPGFGHPPQIAAAAVLPQTGSLAKIVDRIVFGGYARPSGDNPVDFFRSNVVPPWLRNMMTGIGAESSEWSNSFASTTQDVAEVLAITGAHPGMTNGDHAGLYAEARKKSAFLFIVRGLLSFGSPSPAQLKWEIETSNGSALTLRASKEIWGDVYRKHEYDRVSATTEFLTRAGFDPNYMYWSHYEEKWERAVTDEGYELELQHAEQYDEFPITANFAYPDPLWAEFSFNIHNMRIKDDDKRVIDEESHRTLTNQQGGDLEYRNAIALMEWRGNEMRVSNVPEATVNEWERSTRKSISDWTKERWVGWGVDGVIGAFQESTPQDFWEELTLTKGGWFNDPEMMATDAGQGLAAFMPYWNSARSQAQAEGLTPDGWLSSDRAIPTQMFVRDAIEQIIDEHPDFRYLARKAIIPQLSASRELWAEQNPASQLIFDPLYPPDPQAPLTTIPTEMLLEARP